MNPGGLRRQPGKLSVTVALAVALVSLGLIVFIGSSRRAATTSTTAPTTAPTPPSLQSAAPPNVEAPAERVRLEPRFLPPGERPEAPEAELRLFIQQPPPQAGAQHRPNLALQTTALAATLEDWRRRWRLEEARAQLSLSDERAARRLLGRLRALLEPLGTRLAPNPGKEELLITLDLLLRALP